ncbi:hypothetical protein PFISCL1PPCAC_4513, partial [Pristionchus fissidentatus]
MRRIAVTPTAPREEPERADGFSVTPDGRLCIKQDKFRNAGHLPTPSDFGEGIVDTTDRLPSVPDSPVGEVTVNPELCIVADNHQFHVHEGDPDWASGREALASTVTNNEIARAFPNRQFTSDYMLRMRKKKMKNKEKESRVRNMKSKKRRSSTSNVPGSPTGSDRS